MGGRGSGGGNRSGGGGGTLSGVEKSIRNNPYETAVVFNSSGKRIINKTGSEHEVKFSKADLASMKDGTLTHNHPNTENVLTPTFSSADIDLTTRSGLKEMRAVTADTTYSLVKVSNKRAKNKFATDYKDALRREEQRLSLSIPSSKARRPKMASFSSTWLKNNAPKYGYSYSESKK